MNIYQLSILKLLYKTAFVNQRSLAELSGFSLGTVNQSLKTLHNSGFISSDYRPSEKAVSLIRKMSPKNAIILAAGAGMSMVPVNFEAPKALIEINGEALIERIINQLHDVGVFDISVVVGFMKESFEYLIDEFGVELIVNESYSVKNNLHSLALASEKISNTYVIPCDIWCAENPFSDTELYSWYMVSSDESPASNVRINRKTELVRAGSSTGNSMIGIAYLTEPQASPIKSKLMRMDTMPAYDNAFWEESLFENDRMLVMARITDSNSVVEINTYEQLRDFDSSSNQLKSEAIDIIARTLKCSASEITGISVLKKGMTNRSFLFECNGKKYIMRIPGAGTDKLTDRKHEAAVYDAVSGKGICDNVIYIDPSNGYKITEFIENARVCNPACTEDIQKCMKKLRTFHEQNLQVGFDFDIFGQIEFYESLWNGAPSVYKDYARTKENVLSLKPFIEMHAGQKVLTHIDAVPDNFIFAEENGREHIYLIDWEYAGMQDAHVDIAMFCIYSHYTRQQVDALIDAYFSEGCSKEIRIKIYCYISVCGLLWSNWCEYKRSLGVEFGEYSLRQYRYAKEYYRIAQAEINQL